mmetsp:Transcript_12924/g.30656  ORF Transcript_12924/g.30656 Transcript_12924/m.30656 type:complete len:230 (+) Transcript_12924:199-888(+)
MGNSGGKPWESLLSTPETFPAVHKQYIFDDPRCYHAESLLSFSELDFKVRDITDDPQVKYSTVADPKNDTTYTPVFHADTTEWKNWTGHVSRISAWHADENQRKGLYYLSETCATVKAYKVCYIMLEEKGEVIYTVVKKFFSMDSYFIVYEGKEEGSGEGAAYKKLLKLKANWKENIMKLTLAGTDEEPIAIWWTDIVQATKAFRLKVAAGIDHSFVMAIMVAARILEK